ncbi:hypothetical protein PIB30_046507 [Stylosanthes scabra]|uniref:Nuclease associated modular domain-containing protein n=1 Tax=Stylosanthes scabra TaxID=79078 RepID=A0ABU6XFA3_9FABA|nr:hypothetical protein [Stylosanthes scabra]
MHKACEIRAAKHHRGLMHNIREKGAPHYWIPDDIFKQYEAIWRASEYQAMRRANKPNRASSTSESLRTGGSITYPAIAKKMVTEIGRARTQSEVFVRTHTKKKDRGQFVDTRSEQFMEAHKAEMKRLEDERAARIAAGEPAGPPIDEDEVWDRMAGGRKRAKSREQRLYLSLNDDEKAVKRLEIFYP